MKYVQIDGYQGDFDESFGSFDLDEDDLILIGMLADPVLGPELFWDDPNNHEYGGCYRVRDHQVTMFRGSVDPRTGKQRSNEGFACSRDVGKAQPLDAKVLTPDGWTTIGELRIGDLVIGSDGLPTPVIGTYTQGPDRDVYRIEFMDGEVVECDVEHLWTVTCDGWNSSSGRSLGLGARTVSLREILDRKARFKTPSVESIEFAPREDPEIDPWLVGALIGDGNLTRPTMIRFSTADTEMRDRVAALVGDDAELICDGGYNYRIRSREFVLARPGTQHPGRLACRILRWTRENGLQGKGAHEKRVPEEYLWGSVETRLEVLRGLVDTDGSITTAGGVEICTASEGLGEDILHLARSLGGRARVRRSAAHLNGVRHRDRYRVHFTLPRHIEPCWLPRKVERFHERNDARVLDTTWKGIREIALARQTETRCIEVLAADGLYVTNDFILTHNTESIKGRTWTHAFRRHSQNMLMTAPELIHLLPLTDAVENRIHQIRITRDFLDRRGGKTGFTHRPFGVDFTDGTKIVGRIPRLTGQGVKGQHQPDLIMDEAQDYPERGWTEIHSTVMRETTDDDGDPDYHFTFYGVHSGERDTGFFNRAENPDVWRIHRITRLHSPSWNQNEKAEAIASFGGTASADYRRNILGEAGAAASAFFVAARLIACMDQDRESRYNTLEYVKQTIRSEELDAYDLTVAEALDIPSDLKNVWGGMDVGLTTSPTVITLFNEERVGKEIRLKLYRRWTLERFRTKQIRYALYALVDVLGANLKGFGMDVTGLGFPIWQEMEDDEAAPDLLMQIARGYFFNAKVPVGIDENQVRREENGQLRDGYGAAVTKAHNTLTGEDDYVVSMPMIEASTRYLREMVDKTLFMLPFDGEIQRDMRGETQQRVKRVAGLKKKPNAFHILDSMRAMAMVYRAEGVEAILAAPPPPVLDYALDLSRSGMESEIF